MPPDPDPIARIQRQIMWNRLIAVVEEQAQTMIRTAVSTTIREAGDISAGIFDTCDCQRKVRMSPIGLGSSGTRMRAEDGVR